MTTTNPTAACPFHLNLDSPAARATAYAQYEEMRRNGPVVDAVIDRSRMDREDPSGMFGHPVLFTLGYDETVAALADEHVGVDQTTLMTAEQIAALPPFPEFLKPLQQNLLSLDPPDHTRLRRIVQPTFTPRVLESWRPRVQAIADDLIDGMLAAASDRGEREPDRATNLVASYAHPLPMTVICDLMGVPEEDRDQVRDWSAALITDNLDMASLEPALDAYAAYLRALFAAKRERPGDDLTTHLVLADDGGDRLTDDELLAMVFVLIIAGHVTTVNLIGSGVLTLLQHPDQLAKMTANPGLIPNAVEELLRFRSPVEMASPRYAREPFELAGCPMERGQVVVPGLAAANRDPARFPDPGTFDIERANAARHLAFGRGAHLCLGAPLARIEGQVALETLFRRLPGLRLDPEDQQPVLHESLFRGPDALHLRF